DDGCGDRRLVQRTGHAVFEHVYRPFPVNFRSGAWPEAFSFGCHMFNITVCKAKGKGVLCVFDTPPRKNSEIRKAVKY
ncbi:hypothetical protein, partial [uncultured Oscillibacter sp.]|uniref:hypothetical protein n=1 Tax=uncultured Oscillibacter sp. TaxID=876091 RepID=UPI0025D2B9BC